MPPAARAARASLVAGRRRASSRIEALAHVGLQVSEELRSLWDYGCDRATSGAKTQGHAGQGRAAYGSRSAPVTVSATTGKMSSGEMAPRVVAPDRSTQRT